MVDNYNAYPRGIASGLREPIKDQAEHTHRQTDLDLELTPQRVSHKNSIRLELFKCKFFVTQIRFVLAFKILDFKIISNLIMFN